MRAAAARAAATRAAATRMAAVSRTSASRAEAATRAGSRMSRSDQARIVAPPCARSGSAGRRLPDQRRSLARVPHVRELEPRLMVLLRGGHQPRFACAIGHSS